MSKPKYVKMKKDKRLAAKMLLSSSAGNLQMFKEYLLQVGFFEDEENKGVLTAVEKIQSQMQAVRKMFTKPPKEEENEV
jgi:hypothetical protein